MSVSGDDWMAPIKRFISSQEKVEVGELSLAKKVAKYAIIGRDLYQ